VTATVGGADGCRGGWLCVLRKVEPPLDASFFIAARFDSLLDHPDAPAVIAIDIPIGLPERIFGGGRECDLLARANLGKRASAVFAVPARSALTEMEYRGACEAAAAASDPPRQISKQMFHLFPKIREVDAAMTPGLQDRVYECHPEAAFWAMNRRRPLGEPKKRRSRLHEPGLEQRRRLLIANGYDESFVRSATFRAAEAKADDFLDACACAWTAARIHRGEAVRFPPLPPLDAKGLRMEILA
jgi:predicted RNase H-like nuclease